MSKLLSRGFMRNIQLLCAYVDLNVHRWVNQQKGPKAQYGSTCGTRSTRQHPGYFIRILAADPT
eukprot:362057-Chlamydomonas_euryale.AAC.7